MASTRVCVCLLLSCQVACWGLSILNQHNLTTKAAVTALASVHSAVMGSAILSREYVASEPTRPCGNVCCSQSEYCTDTQICCRDWFRTGLWQQVQWGRSSFTQQPISLHWDTSFCRHHSACMPATPYSAVEHLFNCVACMVAVLR